VIDTVTDTVEYPPDESRTVMVVVPASTGDTVNVFGGPAGPTVAIAVFALVAVNVPLYPVSVTVSV
jgi:hypothetical protein